MLCCCFMWWSAGASTLHVSEEKFQDYSVSLSCCSRFFSPKVLSGLTPEAVGVGVDFLFFFTSG